MKLTNSVEKNGYPQLAQYCNASRIKEIPERVLHLSLENSIVPVNPGHRVSMESSVEIVKHCLRGYKLPEPIRQAHIYMQI